MKVNEEVRKLKLLREERGFSLREVARRSGVSPANLSLIENGRISPTLASLRKILEALGYTFTEFFGEDNKTMEEPVFYRRNMKVIEDAHRKYTFLLPKRRQIKVELVFEEWKPEHETEMEVFDFDVAGYLLEGGPVELEIEDKGKWEMNPGDSFYVPAGYRHRGINKGNKVARLLTCYYPPRY